MNTHEALEKVRKLLALANSANEHEAANAANHAAQIMERYRLDAAMLAEAEQRADARNEEGFSSNDEMGAARKHERLPAWYWSLAWAVGSSNRARPRVNDSGRVTFFGRPMDARAAIYMLDYLANEVDRLARRYVSEHYRPRAAGRAFRLGCVHTIAQRLATAHEDVARAKERELSAAEDLEGLRRLTVAVQRRSSEMLELDRWIRSRGFRYGAARTVRFSSASAYRDGRSAGHAVDLGGGSECLRPGPRALEP